MTDDSRDRPKGPSVQARARESAQGNPPLRAVFMGTPDFAATILERLLDAPLLRLAAVYTQPDRPAGRGKAPRAPAVKRLAERSGIPVEQPLDFKPGPDGDAAVATLAAYQPDVLLVAAYGFILPQRVLDIPKYMPINVHGSLLPKYRGAAPVQRAIMNGDAVTGVTIMRMEAGLDSGPMLRQRAVGIGLQDTSGSLMDELAREGAELLLESLERLSSGLLAAIPQDESRATYAAKLTKAEAWIDPRLPARALHAHIRALSPWPGARLLLRREGKEDMPVLVEPGEFPLKAESRAALENMDKHSPVGAILALHGEALLMACGDGAYAFTALRPAGKKSMDGKAFFNGYLAAHPEAAFVHPTEQDNA